MIFYVQQAKGPLHCDIIETLDIILRYHSGTEGVIVTIFQDVYEALMLENL